MSKVTKQVPKSDSSVALYAVSLMAGFVALWFQRKTQDPFNLPKFEVLIILAPISIYFIRFRINRNFEKTKLRLVIAAIIFFLSAFLNATLASGNIYQSMVGLYQRNLGFLTYLCFVILFLAIMCNLTFMNWRALLTVFVGLGSLETLYGLIQFAGKDPIKWKNPYSPILGTFGNPNYQSAFLGVTAAAAVALLIISNRYIKAYLVLQITASLYLILVSNSSQGFMTFGVTSGALALSVIRSNWHKLFAPAAITFAVGIFLGILGILDKGPASFLYQASISARGDYWRAGIAMLKAQPFNGVGIERFGEYFGLYRDLNQVRGRSHATYSDNAHNVFIHFGATGGLPLLLSSIFVWAVVLVIAVLKLRKLTGVHAQSLSTLVAIFLGLVTISLVSPENIGFSVWSWVFAGAIAALSLQQVDETKKVVKKQSQSTDKLVWVLAILLITTTPAVYLVRTVYQADQGIWNSYAVAYGGQGALKDLLVSIENDVAHAPLEQHYKALAASMSLGLGQNSLARDYSKLLLDINPRSMNAYKIIAISYEKEDKFQDAIIARLKYLEFDKYGLENLDKLARDNLALGNKADALTYLANMKKIQAENPLVIALEKELTP